MKNYISTSEPLEKGSQFLPPDYEPRGVCLYLSKRQLSGQIGVSCRTIDNWMRAGKLPFWKIGKVVRFDPSAVREALARFTVRQ